MAFEINKPLEWIAKALGRSTKPGVTTALPSFIDDAIRGTIDILGWERYAERQTFQFVGAATVDRADSTPTPEGTARLVTEASGVHSDTVVDRALMVQLISERDVQSGTPPSVTTLASSNIPVENGVEVPITRRVLLLPGDFLRIRSTSVLGATFIVALNISSIDIEIGEYVPVV